MDRVDSTNGISKNESAAKENANIAENLLEKNIKSGFIVLASRVVAIGVELLKTLLLAVFLSPGEFGIVGSAYLIINSIDNFSKIELESALIQKKEDIRAYLDSAWTFTFLKSSGVTGVLILISPLLAAFFNEQRLVLTIVILSLFTVLRDSKNIGVVYLQKSLNFKKIVIGKIITQISSLVLLILSLIAFRNYFAMLIGYISVYALEFITSFIIHPYRPRFKISMKHVKELMKFSKWMFISYILIFLNNEGDDYVVGRIFGLATLAIYQLAYRISCLPATEIAFVISRTVFPSYSIIQDDK
ncbi:MAG: oligosaccharide flippase family protein, partial [Candidatus Hodarchaeota archaeon]